MHRHFKVIREGNSFSKNTLVMPLSFLFIYHWKPGKVAVKNATVGGEILCESELRLQNKSNVLMATV